MSLHCQAVSDNSAAANGRLSPKHLADLRGSGLSDATIAAAGLHTIRDPAAIAKVLNRQRLPAPLGACLAFPFFDTAGNHNAYTRVKPDKPRLKDGKVVKYESPWKKGNCAYFPPSTIAALTDPATPLLITEGEKKSLAADQADFPCIGLVGVWGWTKNHALIEDLAGVAWKDRTVYLVFDSDAADNADVRRAEWHLAQTLAARGAKVLVVRLPPGLGEVKAGLDDYLIANGPDAFRELIAAAKPAVKPQRAIRPDGRRVVFIRPEEFAVIDEVVSALAAFDPDLYQRGGELVRTLCDPRPDDAGGPPAPRIAAIPIANLRTRITRHVQLAKHTDEGDAAIHPPGWLAEGAAAAGVWCGVRPLVGLSETPVLRRDGSILQTAGYDATTGILYVPQRPYPNVPDRLTRADAEAAAAALREVVCDFPFEKPEHEAAWLAGVLTPLARFAYRGPSPLFLADANIPGCGKSLLTDAAGFIMAEAGFARQPYPAGKDRAEEMRKKITAAAVAGERHMLIDNLPGFIGDSSLDAALTTPSEWTDRILGHTQTVRVPLLMVWWASGNNVAVQGDTARRVLPIRLLSSEEHPEERKGFRHPDLLAWVKDERGRLVTAALTLLAAYLRAGRPDQTLTAWGSFEGWSGLVRSALVWARLPDPRKACEEFANQADTAVAALAGMLESWPEIAPTKDGLTVAKALKKLKDQPDAFEALREALAEFCPAREGELPSTRALGDRLRAVRLRNVGGRRFNNRPAGHHQMAWFVEDAQPADGRPNRPEGESGESGECFSPGSTSEGSCSAESGGDERKGRKVAPGEKHSPDSPDSPSVPAEGESGESDSGDSPSGWPGRGPGSGDGPYRERF
jgi:hypothetical protein